VSLIRFFVNSFRKQSFSASKVFPQAKLFKHSFALLDDTTDPWQFHVPVQETPLVLNAFTANELSRKTDWMTKRTRKLATSRVQPLQTHAFFGLGGQFRGS
jgi:hypothetical protein